MQFQLACCTSFVLRAFYVKLLSPYWRRWKYSAAAANMLIALVDILCLGRPLGGSWPNINNTSWQNSGFAFLSNHICSEYHVNSWFAFVIVTPFSGFGSDYRNAPIKQTILNSLHCLDLWANMHRPKISNMVRKNV